MLENESASGKTRSRQPKLPIIGHSFIFNVFNIWNTVPYSKTITLEQNVRFQGRIWPEQFQLNKIQNGRFAAIIDFNTGNICITVPDS